MSFLGYVGPSFTRLTRAFWVIEGQESLVLTLELQLERNISDINNLQARDLENHSMASQLLSTG